MQINGAESNKVIKHAMKKSEKILDKAKNVTSDKKIDLALTSAAVSGAYIAHKVAVKNHDTTSQSTQINNLNEQYKTDFSALLNKFKDNNEENYNIILNNLDNICNLKNGKIRTSLGSVEWNVVYLSDGNIYAIMTDDHGKVTDSKHIKINPENEDCNFNAVFKGMDFALEDNIVPKTNELSSANAENKKEIGVNINRLGETIQEKPLRTENNLLLDTLKQYGYDEETAKILLSKDTDGSHVFSNQIEDFYFIKKYCPEFIEEIKKNSDDIKLTTVFNQLEIQVNNQKIKVFKESGVTHVIVNDKFEYFEEKKRLSGDKYKTITTIKNLENNTQKIVEQNDTVIDVMGIVHKGQRIKEEGDTFYNNTIVESDGTTRYMEIDLDEQKRYKNKRIVHMSKDGVINAKTEIQYDYSTPGKILTTVKDIDYKNNRSETALLSSVSNKDLYDYNGTYSESAVLKRVRTVTNPSTGEVLTEISKKSDVDKVMNTVLVDSAGNKTVTSLGKTDKNGNVTVKKHFESLDGCKTDYEYKKYLNNTKEMLYKITDKNGKVLMTTERKFKDLGNNKTYTFLNGQEWVTTFGDDKIIIQNLQTGKETYTSFSDLIRENSRSRESLKNDIKNMPADMIEFIAKKYIPIEANQEGSAFCDYYIILKDLDDFPHELGHAKDDRLGKIYQNPEFRTTYEKEKAEYIKAFSGIEKTKIEYLISEAGIYSCDDINRGAMEAVADINELLSGFLPTQRAEVLQQYFPKTIAVASRLLNPNSNILLK